MSVVIETTKGDITVDLYTKERPKTCLNFLKLCKQKLYNNNLFHMIQNNFIAQTGDPTETGRGGDSVFYHLYGDQARYFEAESLPRIKHTKQGQLSMVNCGDNMLGSQFFLTLAEDLDYLDGEHCVFGEVVEGFDIVEVLNETICDSEHRPYQDVRITHMVVLHDPFDDPDGLEARPDSPEPSKELLSSSRIGADENINDYAGKTEEEINEIIAAKEAKARATILEMVGDLPDAECAPPENVLFVCKLNPVTNDDDLEIIFSRFGKVKCCEVIRDKKSGESLQYAFVEFEEESACESAYFKMDNVLIDDRRIHVDFSQSVAKYQWKGKGRLEVKEDKDAKKHDIGEKNKDYKSTKGQNTENYNNRGKVNQSGIREEREENREGKRIKDEKHRSRSRDRYDRRDDKYRRDHRGADRVSSRNADDKYRRNEKDHKDERRDEKYKRENRRDWESREKSDDRDKKGDERDYRDKRDLKYVRDRRDVNDSRSTEDRVDNKDTKDMRDERDNRNKYDRNERYSGSTDRRDRENGERKMDARYAGDDTDRKLDDPRDNEREKYGKDGAKRKPHDERKDNSVRKDKKSKYKSSYKSSSESDDNRRHKKDKKRKSSDSDRRKQKLKKKKKYSDSSDSSSSDSD